MEPMPHYYKINPKYSVQMFEENSFDSQQNRVH